MPHLAGTNKGVHKGGKGLGEGREGGEEQEEKS